MGIELSKEEQDITDSIKDQLKLSDGEDSCWSIAQNAEHSLYVVFLKKYGEVPGYRLHEVHFFDGSKLVHHFSVSLSEELKKEDQDSYEALFKDEIAKTLPGFGESFRRIDFHPFHPQMMIAMAA